ncbi:DUF4282 domain-containing protein [Solimonas terrae]|uniref:DUF4282 domain-containing protein n=1 Tax=Solimonas terrae TaxID=1396819 RepID=A0A6M2BNK3_9GAMM|nr:DUF4282 domain-containing protein [Solimonas terrae]NGY04222.1 DUF4282 domain-containing protein [Solimonas terrae]
MKGDEQTQLKQDQDPAAIVARGLRTFADHLLDYFRALTDFGFRQWLTPRMAPMLYVLGVLGSLYLVVMFVLDGFAQSATIGMGRMLLIGPVAFLVSVTLIRVALEICLVLFRIAVHLSTMAGHTEEIAGGMPRITFWKSWLRRDPPN